MGIQNSLKSKFIIPTIFFVVLLFYYYTTPSDLLTTPTMKSIIANHEVKSIDKIVLEPMYLINTSKCNILNLDPWNEEVAKMYVKKKYVSCSYLPLLTYVEKNITQAKVKIYQEFAQKYNNKITCCYKWIERSITTPVPDKDIQISGKCIDFDEELVINNRTVMISCGDESRTLYSNVHVAATVDNNKYITMQRQQEDLKDQTKPISLLLIGIDSISRLNFYRTMPLTRSFLNKTGWIEYLGYNKVGDNTFPNIMAILTGKDSDYAFNKCDPTIRGKLETCPFIWNDFRKLGYLTAYGEDEDPITTFNYEKKGFVNEPTDFYFKPYMYGAEKLNIKIVDNMHYCTGPEQSGERILNLIKDFSTTFLGHPIFGLFWMNSFSHSQLNTPTRLDKRVTQFFEDLENEGVLEEVMIIFFSDHGLRFGQVRHTTNGWIEERLPYLYFWIPPWLRETFPKEYNNLRSNAKRLTSPYDMYMTIQDILVLSNLSYTPVQSDGCPLCQSLFKQIDQPRSCEETGITTHWCTCNGYVPIKPSENLQLVNQLAKVTLEWIQSKIQELVPGMKKCVKYTLAKVMTASLSTEKNTTKHMLVTFETNPEAIFQATVTLTINNEKNVSNGQILNVVDVSRIDEYGYHSDCVKDARVKIYCYCKRDY